MIGVFDSGVGGLSALLPLCKRMPWQSFWYYADTAALPLGEKTPRAVLARIKKALAFFEEKGAEAVLFACGTASSCLTSRLRAAVSFPIYDIISPVCARMKQGGRKKTTVLLGTSYTVKNGTFACALARSQPLFSLACPDFVPMAEGILPRTRERFVKTLSPLFPIHPHRIVLGCTHFSWLKKEIARTMPRATLIDAAACAAEAVARGAPHWAKAPCASTPYMRFAVTKDQYGFYKRCRQITGLPLSEDQFLLV